jgi:hypothetical protein
MKNVLPIVLSLFLSMGIALADDSEFRLLVSQNDGTVGGEYQVTAQIKITDGQPSPKVVNSLTLDVPHGATLTAPADTAAQSWFVEDASIDGYEVSVSKLDGYYRLLVTSNDVTAGTGWQITNSAWSDIVTLRWVIGSVLPHDVTLTNTTDAAAYYTGTTGDSDAMDWATTPKQGEELKIAVKAFLEGPYSTSTHEMSTALNTADAIPNAAPYDNKSVGTDPADIPADVVDWIKIGLRSTTTGATVNFTSAFLHKSGDIVADDGTTTEFTLPSPEGAGDYYLVLEHRNHLGVMSSALHSLNSTSSSQYDFSSALAQNYSSGAKELESGVYGLYSGDANSDGYVNATDAYVHWIPNNGTSGYKNSDFNLDRYVNATDAYIYWIPNNGKSSTIP